MPGILYPPAKMRWLVFATVLTADVVDLLSVFPRPELGRVFGLFGPLLAASSISGPVLAGFLLWLDPFGLGWRTVFGINVVIGAVLLPLSARVLPRRAGDRSVRLDPAGAVLLIAGLAGVLGGLIQFGDGDGGGDWWPASAVAAGLVILGLFVLRQRRSPVPLLTLSLFRVRSFVAGLVLGSVFFAGVAGLLYATSLYLQFGRGLAPLPAAVMAPASVGIIAASFSTRAFIERLGRRLVAAGLSVMGAGTLGYLAVIQLAPGAVWAVTLPLLVCGLGLGCCFGSLFAVALGDVQPEQAGSASGTLNAVQQVANAVGAALISTVYLAVAAAGTAGQAVTANLLIVLAITGLSLLTLPLLPRRAAAS